MFRGILYHSLFYKLHLTYYISIFRKKRHMVYNATLLHAISAYWNWWLDIKKWHFRDSNKLIFICNTYIISHYIDDILDFCNWLCFCIFHSFRNRVDNFQILPLGSTAIDSNSQFPMSVTHSYVCSFQVKCTLVGFLQI